MVTPAVYHRNAAGEPWERDLMISPLVNSNGVFVYNRCAFNSVVQLLSGTPDIISGLQLAADTAKTSSLDWRQSLARHVQDAIKHTTACTGKVGDLGKFVEALGKSSNRGVNSLVQWVPVSSVPSRRTLVQQDAEDCLRAILSALAEESAETLSQTDIKANNTEAYTFYSLFHAEIVTQVTCPNGHRCKTGNLQQPVLSGVQVPKLVLEGGDGTIQDLMARYMKPTQSCCRECTKLMLDSLVTSTDIWLSLPDAFFVMFIRESEVDSRGHSQRSTVAVTLDEDVTLHYGIGGEASKQYELRRVMFHHGNSSTNGHYTVAARQQHNGKCSQGDDWLYFDSAARPVTYTLPQLAAKFARSVTGVLLVAKANPLPEHHSEVKRSNPRDVANAGSALPPPSTKPFAPSTPPEDSILGTFMNRKTLVLDRGSQDAVCEQLSSSSSDVGSSQAKPGRKSCGDYATSSAASTSGFFSAEAEDRRLRRQAMKEQHKKLNDLSAVAARKQQAKLARQQAYASASTTDKAATTEAKMLPAPLTFATSSAKLSTKKAKAMQRKLNKERKKAELPLTASVITAASMMRPKAAIAGASSSNTALESAPVPTLSTSRSSLPDSMSTLPPPLSEASSNVDALAFARGLPGAGSAASRAVTSRTPDALKAPAPKAMRTDQIAIDDAFAAEKPLVKASASVIHPTSALSYAPPPRQPSSATSTFLTTERIPPSSSSTHSTTPSPAVTATMTSVEGSWQGKPRSKAPAQKAERSLPSLAAAAAFRGTTSTDPHATVKPSVPASAGAFTSGDGVISGKGHVVSKGQHPALPRNPALLFEPATRPLTPLGAPTLAAPKAGTAAVSTGQVAKFGKDHMVTPSQPHDLPIIANTSFEQKPELQSSSANMPNSPSPPSPSTCSVLPEDVPSSSSISSPFSITTTTSLSPTPTYALDWPLAVTSTSSASDDTPTCHCIDFPNTITTLSGHCHGFIQPLHAPACHGSISMPRQPRPPAHTSDQPSHPLHHHLWRLHARMMVLHPLQHLCGGPIFDGPKQLSASGNSSKLLLDTVRNVTEEYAAPSQGFWESQSQTKPPEVGAAAPNKQQVQTLTIAHDLQHQNDRGELNPVPSGRDQWHSEQHPVRWLLYGAAIGSGIVAGNVAGKSIAHASRVQSLLSCCFKWR